MWYNKCWKYWKKKLNQILQCNVINMAITVFQRTVCIQNYLLSTVHSKGLLISYSTILPCQFYCFQTRWEIWDGCIALENIYHFVYIYNFKMIY